jgi:hypothetical protein
MFKAAADFNLLLPKMLCSGKQLVFGSDEEKAMTKALHHCFPDSKHILCTRHLDENVRRKLRHDIGANDSSVQAVIHNIFGKSRLKSAEALKMNGCLVIKYVNIFI